MKRDYSEQAKQELLKIISEVEADSSNQFLDVIGDFFLNVKQFFGFLNIDDYLNNLSKYHKEIIDKNDISKKKLEEIFSEIYAINYRYKIRLASIKMDMDSYLSILKTFVSVVEPSKAISNPLFISSAVQGDIDDFISQHKVLDELSVDGITSEDVESLGSSTIQEVVSKLGYLIVQNLPSVKLGDKIEIPIGPGLTLSYSVSGKIDGEGDSTINMVVEDQKVKFDKYKWSYKTADGVGSVDFDSEGEVTGNLNIGNTSGSVNENEIVIKQKYETFGTDTYAVSVKMNPVDRSISIEYSITTDLEKGSITSTMKMSFTDNDNWKPIPSTVPEYTPSPSYLPDWNLDWGSISEKDVQILIVGGVVLVVVAGVAIATGGAGAAVGALALV